MATESKTELMSSVMLRKELLKLEKKDLARKCTGHNVSVGGTKADMANRLLAFNEKHGGVTATKDWLLTNENENDNDKRCTCNCCCYLCIKVGKACGCKYD
eukprot:73914_1